MRVLYVPMRTAHQAQKDLFARLIFSGLLSSPAPACSLLLHQRDSFVVRLYLLCCERADRGKLLQLGRSDNARSSFTSVLPSLTLSSKLTSGIDHHSYRSLEVLCVLPSLMNCPKQPDQLHSSRLNHRPYSAVYLSVRYLRKIFVSNGEPVTHFINSSAGTV